ncbi:MAG: hypothetical protein R3D52_11610 [Xanthobacteraceae bacterium]
MPVTSEPDLPIRYVPIGGPAVEALDRRKESSSNPLIAAAELRDSYNNVKGDLFAGIKALAQSASGPTRR